MRNWGFLLSYREIVTWPKPAFPVHHLQNRKPEKKLPSSPTLRKPHDTAAGATPILKLLSENSSLLLRNCTACKPRRINPCLQDFFSKWNFSRVKTLSFYWGFKSSLFHSCLSPRRQATQAGRYAWMQLTHCSLESTPRTTHVTATGLTRLERPGNVTEAGTTELLTKQPHAPSPLFRRSLWGNQRTLWLAQCLAQQTFVEWMNEWPPKQTPSYQNFRAHFHFPSESSCQLVNTS